MIVFVIASHYQIVQAAIHMHMYAHTCVSETNMYYKVVVWAAHDVAPPQFQVDQVAPPCSVLQAVLSCILVAIALESSNVHVCECVYVSVCM